MEKKNGPWIIKNTETRYKDEFIEFNVDQVIKPDGDPGNYATVVMKSGVAILPVDNDGNVFLTQQFRYVLGKDSIEVISGGIDEDGNPLEAAKREASEEMGIEAKTWTPVGIFDLDTSMVKCPVHLYICTDLTFKKAHPDSTESIKKLKKSFDEALQMVMNNEITHAPSCILLLKAQIALQKSAHK